MRRQAESSESEISEDENQFKLTANPQHNRNDNPRKYNQSSESDISSLSEQDEEVSEKRYQNILKNNKQTIQHHTQSDSQADSEESSGIDQIQQRIRRLENDLEYKIDKQKDSQNMRREQSQSSEKREETKGAGKGYGNPPLPSKKVEHKQTSIKQDGPVRNLNSSQNKNSINIVDNKSDQYLKQTTKSTKKQDNKHIQKQSKISPKKPAISKTIEQKVDQANQASKIRQSNSAEQSNNTLLKQAYQQINQMHRVIEQLRNENFELKKQLANKDKKQKKHQYQQIEVLKTGAASQNLKLQKEIETLKALQSLQKKLKKSIAKKQRSNGIRNSSAAQLATRKC